MVTSIAPQYLNGKQAAIYTGYSESTFREIAKEFEIPRCGPRNNRYSKTTLDDFMSDPLAFKKQKLPRRRRPEDGFTPVTA